MFADLYIGFQATAFQHHLLVIFLGELDHLEQALQKGRESGYDKAAFGVLYIFF